MASKNINNGGAEMTAYGGQKMALAWRLLKTRGGAWRRLCGGEMTARPLIGSEAARRRSRRTTSS